MRPLSISVGESRRHKSARAARRAAAETKARHDAGVAKAREILHDIVERESETLTEYENLTEALDERLENDEAYAHLEDTALDYVVLTICKDLGIDPNRHVWSGPGVPPRPPLSRPKYSVFTTPGRNPRLARPTFQPDTPAEPPAANDAAADPDILFYDPAPSIRRE